MSKHNLHLANTLDLDWICEQINACRLILATHQSDQWQGREPSFETLQADVNFQQYYLYAVDQLRVGGAAILPLEPAYDHLTSGKWLNDDPYWVIHRLFIRPDLHAKGHGLELLNAIEALAFTRGINNLRIDTHQRNMPMRKLLIKAGYHCIGEVNLPHAGARLVYHKVIGK